jgi:hypothetical protein
MTSLSPLIVRTYAAPQSTAPRHTAPRPHPVRAFAVESLSESDGKAYEDLKLFATGWVAGLIFFGTLLA